MHIPGAMQTQCPCFNACVRAAVGDTATAHALSTQAHLLAGLQDQVRSIVLHIQVLVRMSVRAVWLCGLEARPSCLTAACTWDTRISAGRS